MEGLNKVTPDKERASSIVKMAESTHAMIQTIDESAFPSNVTKEYYDIIQELASVILLLDGYKTSGEGAHITIIMYLKKQKLLSDDEVELFDELRKLRTKIAYDGFFVQKEYIQRKKPGIESLILKLKEIIGK